MTSAQQVTVGAVVVSELVPSELTGPLRQAASEYEQYKAIRVTKGWIEGVYLALFVMITLLILVSATWFGLYLAKRITRPVQMLAEGAKAIGEGKLDLHIEPQTGDELGSLVAGKRADFVVLGGNPLTVDGDAIAGIPVLATWVDGTERFHADGR